MRVGNDECYLRIEKTDAEDPHAPYRVEARLSHGNSTAFLGVNDRVYFSNGEGERHAFTEFAELRSRSVTLAMTEEGTIELRRGVRGNIDVFVSIGFSRSGTHWTTSGVVPVHGEDALQFLRELRKLVFEPR